MADHEPSGALARQARIIQIGDSFLGFLTETLSLGLFAQVFVFICTLLGKLSLPGVRLASIQV